MANVANILAGSKAAGPTGLSLAWFAPAGTTLPVDNSTALTASFLDAGACDPKGVTVKQNVSTSPIKVFGTLASVGTLFTGKDLTIDVTFMETNGVSAAIHAGLPVDGVTVAADGSFSVVTGAPVLNNYVAVFDSFAQDGSLIRYVAPNVQNTTPGDLVVSQGAVLSRDVTLSLLPDANGNILYEYYTVNALASAAPAWQPTHAYELNDEVTGGGHVYKATTAGSSGSTEPTWPGSGTVTDGTVEWTFVS